MVYIVLMIVVIVISTGITVYVVYYNWSLIKNNTHKETLIWWVQLCKMGTTKQINIKNRTYYFYNDIIDLENFDAKLLKIDKKSYKDVGIYNIWYVMRKKIDDCIDINSVNPLYLNITNSNGFIEEKGIDKYLISIQQMQIKKYLKNIKMFLMGLEIKLKK